MSHKGEEGRFVEAERAEGRRVVSTEEEDADRSLARRSRCVHRGVGCEFACDVIVLLKEMEMHLFIYRENCVKIKNLIRFDEMLQKQLYKCTIYIVVFMDNNKIYLFTSLHHLCL